MSLPGAKSKRTARVRSLATSEMRLIVGQQALAVDHHAAIVVARDDFHVVRKVHVDHARQEAAVAGFEEELVVGNAELHGAVLAALETQDLAQRFARNEDREVGSLLSFAAVMPDGKVDQRHAVAVRGHHLHLVRLHFEQRAVELEARLLVRDGELHLADHRLQLVERDA